MKYFLVLASQSIVRKEILEKIGLIPDKIIPANINEDPLKKEKPNNLVRRLAIGKGNAIAKEIDNGFIISADTICWTSHKIIGKAYSDEDVRNFLNMFSGKTHSVFTGVAVTRVIDNKIDKISTKNVVSKVKFKNLTKKEIEDYIASKEGIGASGGLRIAGYASSFIKSINGSYTAILGLPAYEVKSLLLGMGYNA